MDWQIIINNILDVKILPLRYGEPFISQSQTSPEQDTNHLKQDDWKNIFNNDKEQDLFQLNYAFI